MQPAFINTSSIRINIDSENLLIEFIFESDPGNKYPFIPLSFILPYDMNIDFQYLNDDDRAVLIVSKSFTNLKQLRQYEKNHCNYKTTTDFYYLAQDAFNMFVGGIIEQYRKSDGINLSLNN